jgi:hypothetical protein
MRYARLSPAWARWIALPPARARTSVVPISSSAVWTDAGIEHQYYGLGSIPHEIPVKK